MADDQRIGIAIEAINNASGVLKQVQSDLQDLNGQAKTTSEGVSTFSDSLGGLSSQLFGIGAALSISLTAPLTLLGKTMVDQVSNIEQLRVSFDTFLGSATAGAKALNDLQQFAAKTPFQLPEVAAAGKQLLAFGLQAQDLIPTLKSIGDVAAGTGGDLSHLTLIFGQIRNEGQLTGRTLRELAIAGIPIEDVLAKNLGVAKDQIKSMTSAGQIGFNDIQKAFQSMTSEGGKFFDLMEKQSHTFGGVISNIQDNFVRLSLAVLGLSSNAADFGAIIEGGPFAKLKELAEGTLGALDQLVQYFQKLDVQTRTTIVGVGLFVAALGPLALIAAGLTAAFAALITPVGLILTGFTATGAAAIIFRDQLSGIFETVLPLAEAIKNLAVTIGTDLLLVINPIVSLFGGWAGITIIIKGIIAVATEFLNILTSISGVVGSVLGVINDHLKEFAVVLGTIATVALIAFGEQIDAFLVGAAFNFLGFFVTGAIDIGIWAAELIGTAIPAVVSFIAALGPLALGLIAITAALGAYGILVANLSTLVDNLNKKIEAQAAFNRETAKSYDELAKGSDVFSKTATQLSLAQNKAAAINDEYAKQIKLQSDLGGLGATINAEAIEQSKEKITQLEKERDAAFTNAQAAVKAQVDAIGEIGRHTTEFAELRQKTTQEEFDKAVALIKERGGVEDTINQAILDGAVDLTQKKIDLLQEYNVTEESLITDAAKLDENTLKQRLVFIQQYQITDFNIKQAILNASGEVSIKDLEIFKKNVDDKLKEAAGFKTNLANLLAQPTIHKIILDIQQIGGPAITNAVTGIFNNIQSGIQGLLNKAAVASAAAKLPTENTTLTPESGGGGGGGGKGKAETQQKQVDDLIKSLKDLGATGITEGGKVVDTFSSIQDGIDKVQKLLKTLNDDQAKFLSTVNSDQNTINKYLDPEKFVPPEIPNQLKDVQDKVNEVTKAIGALVTAHQKWIDDAKKGLDEYSAKVDALNKKYDDLTQKLADNTANTIANAFNDALDKRTQLTTDLAKAQDDLSKAQTAGDATAVTAAQQKIVDLQKQLADAQATITEVNTVSPGAEQQATTAQTGPTSDQQALIDKGKALVLTQGNKELESQIAEIVAKRNLSTIDFLYLQAGLQTQLDQMKKVQESIVAQGQLEQAQADLAKAKQAGDKANIDALTKQIADLQGKAVGSLNPNDFKDANGILTDAGKALVTAQQTETAFKAGLLLQQNDLENYKKKELDIYTAQNKELQNQQQALEDFLKLSYDKIIAKLKEVQAQAIATAQALQAAGGNSTQVTTAVTKPFASGGFTDNVGENTPAGVVHGGEWVAPKWMVEKFKGMFSQLEQMRENKGASFAQGGNVDNSQQRTINQPITMHNTIHDKLDFDDVGRLLAWRLRTAQ